MSKFIKIFTTFSVILTLFTAVSCNNNVATDDVATDDAVTDDSNSSKDPVTAIYTVTFNSNDGKGTMNPQKFTSGINQNLSENVYTKDFVYFGSWNTKADGSGTSYSDKQSITISADTTLYAQWNEYKILPAGTEGTAGPDWTYVLFGFWPQTKKDASVTVDENEKTTIGTATSNPYTYCKGDDGNWYYKVNSDYYMVEPIKWRVLTDNFEYNNEDNAGDKACFLLAEKVLDAQKFFKYDKSSQKNNYKNSTIRSHLNNVFLQNTFSQKGQDLIEITKVDNSKESTGTSQNQYACEDTKDKIFLLSYKEVNNTAYSLSTNDNNYRASTIRIATDFADINDKSDEVSPGATSDWMLRSPYASGSDYLSAVRFKNAVGMSSTWQTFGIVPALCIKL